MVRAWLERTPRGTYAGMYTDGTYLYVYGEWIALHETPTRVLIDSDVARRRRQLALVVNMSLAAKKEVVL